MKTLLYDFYNINPEPNIHGFLDELATRLLLIPKSTAHTFHYNGRFGGVMLLETGVILVHGHEASNELHVDITTEKKVNGTIVCGAGVELLGAKGSDYVSMERGQECASQSTCRRPA